MIYYLLAFFIYFCILFTLEANTNSRSIMLYNKISCYFIIPGVLIFLGGFRWLTGTDWNSYFYFFTNHDTWQDFNNGSFEILYALLNFLSKTLYPSYTLFLLLFTFLIIVLKFNAISKLCKYYGVAIFLMYCYTAGDILAVRQTLASAILLRSVQEIRKKNVIGFICVTLIAFLIHNTAIVWFFSYYIYWKKKRRLVDICSLLFFVCLGILGMGILGRLLLSLVNLLPFTGVRAFAKFFVYAMDAQPLPFNTIVVNILKRVFIFPLLFFYEKKISKDCDWYSGVLSLYIFGTCIYFSFMLSFNVFQRFSNYFVELELLLLSSLYGVLRKENKLLGIQLIFVYGLLKLKQNLTPFIEVKDPYYTIFNYEDRVMGGVKDL